MKRTICSIPTKCEIFAFICFALFISTARSETEIVNMDDAGFIHIRSSRNSTTEDHFVRLSQIAAISIHGDKTNGVLANIKTSGQVVSVDFATREEAEAAVRRIMEAIKSAR